MTPEEYIAYKKERAFESNPTEEKVIKIIKKKK